MSDPRDATPGTPAITVTDTATPPMTAAVQVASIFFAAGTPPTTPSGAVCGTLGAGQTLVGGQAITACSNQYHLILQENGNLVEYNGSAIAVWSTVTGVTGAPAQSGYGVNAIGTSVVMQNDGNFVLYNNGSPTWSSRTSGNPGATLSLQVDGNIVVYLGGRALWSSQLGNLIGQ